MKIIVLLGSPRKKSDSSSLAAAVAAPFGNKGHEIITHRLNDLRIRGCQACRTCKTTRESCILKDDLARVLEDIVHGDVIIMATPVYWGEVSAQMKLLIDRLYSFLTPNFMNAPIKHRLPAGKQLVFIQTQGAVEQELYGDIFPRYNTFFEKIGFFEKSYLIRCCGLNEQTPLETFPELMKEAAATARLLMEQKQEQREP